MATPKPKNSTLNKMLETANWRFPLIPCPLVQPPANLAPKTMIKPPRKATASRLVGFGPKRDSHMGGT